ncbi:unnamed protein product [Oppiella nova]|uniref:Uncharacterized protein n=1 Tax=Oppiella nova TaxID=334625 RepID=A0A7R9L7S4_9ACAR|nr:unnamed protein product [Oppiella nova]CAG2157406.1 unnamed protein product [Oppiella nova]
MSAILRFTFVWMKAYIPWVLGIIMLGMGMTMTVDEFKNVLSNPKAVVIGVVAHFVVMPSVAFFLYNMLAFFSHDTAIFISKNKQFTTTCLDFFHIGFKFIQHVIIRCKNHHRHIIVDQSQWAMFQFTRSITFGMNI